MEQLDEPSRRRPAPQDSEPLQLSILLPSLKRPRLDLPGAGEEDQSSSLDQGSQSSLMGMASAPPSPGFSTGLGSIMDLFSGRDPTASYLSSMFPPSGGEGGVSEMDKSSTLQTRAQQLQMLSSEASDLSSPIGFSPSHAIPDPPDITSPHLGHSQTKGNLFNNFFIATNLADDVQQQLDITTFNKQSSRHLIFAAYFPMSRCGFGKQERNERAVVLCGVGRTRQRVEGIVKRLAADLEQYCRFLQGMHTPLLLDHKFRKLMVRFESLPTFEQHVIATSCEDILQASLSRKVPYPACSQLVFVCELLDMCGAISQLLSLLVDIIACDFPATGGSKTEHRRVQATPPSLPGELCLPVLWLLQKYLSCLLLSQHDTAVIFEK